MKDLVVTLRANTSQYKAAMASAGAQTKAFGKDIGATLASSDANTQKVVKGISSGMLVMGGAVLAGFGLAAKAAIDFESSFAGVRKTVDGTEAQMGQMREGILAMARAMPASAGEISKVAEAAGQLGIQRDAILGFSKVMIDLGQTTNLSSDEAATSIARFANIMGTSQKDFDRLGSTLVDLGNKGASTEREIMDMTLRLGGAGKLIGASEPQIMALANAMSSLGIQAELGGGAFGRVMLKIYKGVQEGGLDLQNFAKLSGISAEEFSAKWKADPIRTIDLIIKGLAGIKDSGGNVVKAMNDMGIEGTQEMQVMLSLLGAGNLLTESLDNGAKAWDENTALLKEAEERYKTTASQLQLLKNNVVDVGISLGTALLPAINGATDQVGYFLDGLRNLPEPMQNIIAGGTGVVGVVSLLGGGFLALAPKLVAAREFMSGLAETAPRLATTLKLVGVATAGVSAVLMLGALALAHYEKKKAEVRAETEKFVEAIKAERQGTADALRSHVAKELQERKALTNARAFGVSTRELTDAILGQQSAVDQVSTKLLAQVGPLQRNAETQQLLKDSLNGSNVAAKELAYSLFKGTDTSPEMIRQIMKVVNATGDLSDSNSDASRALRELEQAQLEAGVSVETVNASVGKEKLSLDALTQSEKEAEAAAKALKEEHDALATAINGFIDPLGAYTGLLAEKEAKEREGAEKLAAWTEDQTDTWQTYVKGVDVSITEYLASLQRQIDAQANWETNLLRIAARGHSGVMMWLAKMGPEGAELVAKFADASEEELNQMAAKLPAIMGMSTAGMVEELQKAGPVLELVAEHDGKKVADGFARKLALGEITVAGLDRIYGELERAGPVLQEVADMDGQKVADGYARALRRGEITVADIVGRYGGLVTASANAAISDLDRIMSRVASLPTNVFSRSGFDVNEFIGQANGGFHPPPLERFANGGESHYAHIARGGTRVWNEPETGGEAYIPLSMAKRAQSTAILGQTAEHFGMQLSRQYDTPAAVGGPMISGTSVTINIEGSMTPGEQLTRSDVQVAIQAGISQAFGQVRTALAHRGA